MTSPQRSHLPTQSDDRPALRIGAPGELIAALPAMLGFHPRESLVLVATGGRSGRRLGLTVRIDLPPPEHPDHRAHAHAVAASAVAGLLRDGPAGAVVVVVSDVPDAAVGDPGLPQPVLVETVARALGEHGVDAHTLLWAQSTTGGGRWACYDPCACSGRVPDPAATAFVAAAVADGRVVHADRAALERLVAPTDPERLRRREQLLIRATDEALAGSAPGGAGLVVEPEAGTAVVEAAITDTAAGRLELSDERVVALASALAIPLVRDTALQWCAGGRAGAAEQLWAALVRETPEPEAAESAVLLAVSALLRGDGALANVALARAERAWPGHRLSRLLRVAADRGLRPGEVRAWLSGYDTSDRAPAGARRPRR